MWTIDSATQEVVWTDEPLYADDLANDDREDEGGWSSEEAEAAYDWWIEQAIDSAMEASLFGWDA
jgi:hypothetical protein